MGSLKDALLKAGLKGTKNENDRNKLQWKDASKSVKHQQQRNYCEVCHTVQPDVERYKHRNPTIDAQWICSACADRNQIPDETRVTNQSDFALKGMFRREFGPTKKFNKVENEHRKKPDGKSESDGRPQRKYPGRHDDRRDRKRLNSKNRDNSKANNRGEGSHGRRKSFKKERV